MIRQCGHEGSGGTMKMLNRQFCEDNWKKFKNRNAIKKTLMRGNINYITVSHNAMRSWRQRQGRDGALLQQDIWKMMTMINFSHLSE